MESRENVSKPPCRACSDFKSWAFNKNDSKKSVTPSSNEKPSSSETLNHDQIPVSEGDGITSDALNAQCPLDREELGNATWGFLHTMASYYPKHPSTEQQEDMTKFVNLFAKFFPCHECADDLREKLKTFQPITSSRRDFENWMCELHNDVNRRIGKPVFDCSKVPERWRDGWKDGSCD